MRPLTTALALVVLFAVASLAAGEKRLGKPLTLKEKTKVSAITAAPATFHQKRVLVEGAIVEVCKKRGCWMKIASDKEHEAILFKVDDGVMVFPVEMTGWTVLAEGTVLHAPAEPKKDGHDCQGCCSGTVLIRGEGAVVRETATR